MLLELRNFQQGKSVLNGLVKPLDTVGLWVVQGSSDMFVSRLLREEGEIHQDEVWSVVCSEEGREKVSNYLDSYRANRMTSGHLERRSQATRMNRWCWGKSSSSLQMMHFSLFSLRLWQVSTLSTFGEVVNV